MTGRVVNLGRLPYGPCTELQRRLLDEVASNDRANTLLLVEHDPVLTLGANFHREHLLLDEAGYKAQGIEVHTTERGGDVTYHGPGQLVIYPIFRLNDFGRDLHLWLRNLEEAVLQCLKGFGLDGYRFPPHTGVWVNGAKIAAIGIKVRKWTSMHGIALNCDNDLRPFQYIVPCGIQGYGVTSLTRELQRQVGVEETRPRMIEAFASVFDLQFEEEAL